LGYNAGSGFQNRKHGRGGGSGYKRRARGAVTPAKVGKKIVLGQVERKGHLIPPKKKKEPGGLGKY